MFTFFLIVGANLVIYILFTMLYFSMGMEEHFVYNNTSIKRSPLLDTIYFSAIAHTTTGFGDITPKTDLAKALTALHVLSAWGTTLVLSAGFN